MPRGNRMFKDRLFRFVFKDKKRLLSLYNALNQSDYKDENALEITTLEDFIYMGMKNDISFILDSDMCLYEHQSTINPNMPLRGLFYFSDLLQKFIEENHYRLYGKTLISLPTPQFVVFYNGDDTVQERSVLKLSDAFENKSKPGCLEVEALMLDVNVGKNKDLMKSCRELQDYATFVGKVKEYKKDYDSLEETIDKAIDYCIEHDIMREILVKHRVEVARMIFREFDEAEYRRQMEEQKKEEIAQYIAEYKTKIDIQKKQLSQKDEELSQKNEELFQKDEELSQKDGELSQKDEEISRQKEQLTEQVKELELYKKILAEHGLLKE